MRDADSLLHLGLFRAFRNSAGLWSLSLMFSGQLFPFLPLELPSTRGSCRMVSDRVSWPVTFQTAVGFFSSL